MLGKASFRMNFCGKCQIGPNVDREASCQAQSRLEPNQLLVNKWARSMQV